MTASVAGIDVHKRVLMVVVLTPDQAGVEADSLPSRRFRTTIQELRHLVAWLQQLGVQEAVMESTAQYWKPVWLVLEQHFRLYLAQAWSNRAPRGKKADFKDAQRLIRRHLAGELTLSFVPDGEQRLARTLTRRRTQLTRDRVRIQNQVESLLEETQVKLSSLVSDLFGASGVRILQAISDGVADPVKLAQLGDARLQHTPEELAEALTGNVSPWHRQLLKQHLEQLRLVDKQLQELSGLTASALKIHAEAIERLVQVPGIRVVAAQQIVAEAGPEASAFATAGRFSSWIGVCPGSQQSAGENHSSRCAKGNLYLRRVLCLAAQAAVRTKNSSFQQRFRRLLPRLGYTKAIWATAHRLAIVIWKILHDRVAYKEYGLETTPQARKRRIQRVQRELRALGYDDQLKLLAPQP